MLFNRLSYFFVGLGLMICFCTEKGQTEEDHEHLVGTLDPYHETIELLNITDERGFTAAEFEIVVEELFEHLHCEHDHDEEEETHADEETCNKTLCLDIGSFLTATDNKFNGSISEELFGSLSTSLVYIATNISAYCHSHVVITSDDVTRFRENLVTIFSDGQPNRGLKLGNIQETLEALHLEESHDHSENHIDVPDAHDDGTGTHTEEDHETEDHVDEHVHAEVIEEKCLSGDILFDQLGFDVDNPLEVAHLDDITASIVYYILTGSHVSRTCRILPRTEFFAKDIYSTLEVENNTLSHEGFEDLRKRLGLFVSTEVHTDDEDEHNHRKRRSVDVKAILENPSWSNRCYTGEELFAIYQMPEEGIPIDQFRDICPALIQQQLSKTCLQPTSDDKHDSPTDLERYGWGTLATVIVCLASVVGIIVVPLSSKNLYRAILAVFMGMAVGTLTTDALLHLLPTALGIHEHGDDDHDHDHAEDDIVVEPFLVYSLVACGGLYVFYLFEKCMHLLSGKHTHSHGDHCADKSHDIEISAVTGSSYILSPEKSSSYDSIATTKAPYVSENDGALPNGWNPIESKKKGLTPLAIMVLVGDGIHNFADGLAIGAAFTDSISLGISTSIAVLCHEIPHELGDFAVLLSSGLSMCKALLFNFISSLSAMAGLYVGLVISAHEETRTWIVAVTAGMFLYIALVNLMPQLLETRKEKPVKDFIFHNIGILLGAAVMLLLAVFEERIKIK